MENSRKIVKAINILKETADFKIIGDILTEEDFNKIEWVVSTNGDQAVLSTTNPHSELTWEAVKAEMDKL